MGIEQSFQPIRHESGSATSGRSEASRAAGWQPRHTSEQFVAFLEEVVARQPEQREIHVICDNVSSHKTGLVEDFLAAHEQVHSRGIFTSVKDRDKKLMRYIRQYNKGPKPLKWKHDDPLRRHHQFF